MSVSQCHENLVLAILNWLQIQRQAAGEISISADCVSCGHLPNPPALNGFIPDVYAVGIVQTITIIGEAKTPRDLETPRSRAQFESFIMHLANLRMSQLVIATPWVSVNSAKAIIRSIKKKQSVDNVDLVFLEPLSP